MTRRPYIPTTSDIARRERVYLDKPGTYLTRLGKDKPEVPALVTYGPTPDPSDPANEMDRTPWFCLYVVGLLHRKPALFPDWTLTGKPIDRDEYDLRLAQYEWDLLYAPDSPQAQIDKPINLRTMSPRDLLRGS